MHVFDGNLYCIRDLVMLCLLSQLRSTKLFLQLFSMKVKSLSLSRSGCFLSVARIYPHCYSEASLCVFVQAILCGNFWYREYGLVQCSLHRPAVKVTALLQQRASPLLEKLNRLLEEKQLTSFSPSTCNQPVSVTQSAPDRGKTLVTGCTTHVLHFSKIIHLTFPHF